MPVQELQQRQVKVTPRPTPELVPPPDKGRGPLWPWLGVVILLALAVGIYMLVRPGRPEPVVDFRKVTVEAGPIHRTIRVTGVTQAARYATITPPHLEGSRSGRGRTSGGSLIQADSTVTVRSTSTVSSSSTTSSLSATGSVTSTADSGGSVSGSPSGASSALQAATSRIGGSSSTSGGNVTTTSSTTSTSGSTDTASAASSSTSSSGRPRGDFHMALRKLLPAGTRVSKGDVIAEFDSQYMTTRLDDYATSVAQVEASYRKGQSDLLVNTAAHTQSILSAKGALDKARLDVKAAPVLSAINAEKLRLEVEEAEAEWKELAGETRYVEISNEAQLRDAEIEVKQAQVELDRVRANLDKLVVRSPIDGMVVRLDIFSGGEFRQVKEGDELHPGMPFVKVVDTSSMIVDAMVNQVDIDKMRIGQKAIARFDAFPDLELPARVHAVGTVAKARQFRREYVTEVPIQLKLEITDPRVIPDLSVAADIILETSNASAAIVPLEAVMFSEESAEHGTVYVETPKGWRLREVSLGMRNHVSVEVTSGLEAGDAVALTDQLG